MMLDCFSSTYREARARFLDAANERAALHESYCHPSVRGPSGEALTADVATLGWASAERVLMIVSGTHGVEGHAGSACQIALLKSDFVSELAQSVRLVLVHAINPYGFAHSRRTNEDNIDLNRNFVDFSQPTPRNLNYEPYARAFLPAGSAWEDYLSSRERLEKEAAACGGYEFLKKALQPGQYEFPDGLYYGGAQPSWSNQVFMQICNQAFDGCERAAVLDIHTGLGSPGAGELIFMDRDLARRYAQCFTPPVSCAGGQESVSASVKGPLVTAAYDRISASASTAICAALEFGTVSLQENVEAKVFENWTYTYLSPLDPLRQASIRRFRDAYFCDDALWKKRVIERSNEIVRSMHRCLNS
jgi:hypothetical protein